MSAVNSDSVRAGASGAGDYTIDQSCRFNDDDSAQTTWTPGVTQSNTDIGTLSMWLKRGNITSVMQLYNAGAANEIQFNASNQLVFTSDGSGSIITTQVFRDVGAWGHLVVAWDTSQGTAASRVKIYWNGVQITVFGTAAYPTQDQDLPFFKNAVVQTVAANEGDTEEFDGYLADFVGIDGTQYAASDFGESDDNGNWVPVKVSGLTFGTNGFYLDFANSSDFGSDQSGNSNDFTDAGLATNDQIPDSPTDDAADNVGNYCTLNPLYKGSAMTLSNGNLEVSVSTNWHSAISTWVLSSGKWYWEWDCGSTDGNFQLGVIDAPTTRNLLTGTNNVFEDGWTIEASLGKKATHGGTGVSYGSAYADDDIGMVAVDMDNGEIWWGEGGTWFNSGDPAARTNPAYTDLLSGYTGEVAPGVEVNGDNVGLTMNFGQLGFEHTIPVGFKSLCTANLPAPTITDPSTTFQTTLYTGNGTAIGSGGKVVNQSGRNSTFQPDFVWIKNRDAGDQHILTDAARGVTKYLSSDGTDAEATDTETLSTFDSDGFTVGDDVQVNTNTEDYAAWQWLAGGGAGSSNTAGSINTTTTSVGTTQGFSISTYTGTGVAATIGHGLGAVPELIIVKRRDSANNWITYNKDLSATPEDNYIYLDTYGATGSYNFWNSTAPTSTVFSISTDTGVNGDDATYVAYCWTSINGYSKVGRYTGNANADGPFAWCGFRPAFVLIKGIDQGQDWWIWDTKRNASNPSSRTLRPSDPGAEESSGTTRDLDILSNGFKVRNTDGLFNASGGSYLFLAFAKFPFGGEDVSQARAR